MSPVIHLGLASLLAIAVAACSTAPAAPDLSPPPPRRLDAKTQLEYGAPPPPPPGPRY
ncbi:MULTISPECIES: hypothetical protein [unclassified Methylobacterium]|uniref:hypothetical protein n=1 Tax=unclassified Methylobacterium TaxID=2615210 RepID=UPI000AB2F76E|nr:MULTISPECIES: hypothetical protein [unclassified Methylobacterium]MCK2054222.1 hypothetical protein [Methylobacterium sp. 37f]